MLTGVNAAYLGPDPATYGYMAVSGYFPANPKNNFVPFASHAEIIQAVGDQEIDFGVVAIENRIDGAIAETIRAMEEASANGGVHVCGEIIVNINHHLLRLPNTKGLPKVVLTHQSAQRQCSVEIKKLINLGIDAQLCNSTGEAALLASQDPNKIAIAGPTAEDMYPDLVRISFDSERDPNVAIGDFTYNQTRFWVVSTQVHKKTGHDKTAILINLDHDRVGGISKFTAMFAAKGLNLLWIYPHPIPARPWEYAFLVEYTGHASDPEMKSVLSEFYASGLALNRPLVLGSYPIAKQLIP